MTRRVAAAVALAVGAAGLAGAATVAPGLTLTLLAFGGGAVAAVAAPPAILLAVPLFVVQVFGEGFQVGGPLAAAQLSYVLVLVAAVRVATRGLPTGPGRIDRALAAWFLTVAVFAAFGLATGATPGAVREDAVPLAILGASYVATRLVVRDERAAETAVAVVLLGTFCAAVKAAYVLAVPVDVGWDTQWQAARVPGGGVTRVLLRGGDLFFVVGSLLVIGRAISGRVRFWEVLVGVASLGAMLVAGTRSNWLGWAAGLLVIVVTGSLLRMARPRRAVMAFTLAIAFGTCVLAAFPGIRGWTATQFTEARSRLYTLEFRAHESSGVLAAIGETAWLGGGLGRLYTFWDIDGGRLVTTTWSHNAFLQVALKTGLLGLAVFLFAIGRSCVLALQVAARLAGSGGRFIGLCGGMVAIVVLSLAANKIFESSGAMFLGLALALTQARASERTG